MQLALDKQDLGYPSYSIDWTDTNILVGGWWKVLKDRLLSNRFGGKPFSFILPYCPCELPQGLLQCVDEKQVACKLPKNRSKIEKCVRDLAAGGNVSQCEQKSKLDRSNLTTLVTEFKHQVPLIRGLPWLQIFWSPFRVALFALMSTRPGIV